MSNSELKMKKNKPASKTLVSFLIYLLLAATAQSQSVRDFQLIPKNINSFRAYYIYGTSNTFIDLGIPFVQDPSLDVNVDINIGALTYNRSFNVGGQLAFLQLIYPYGFVNATVQSANRTFEQKSDGTADPMLGIGTSITGAPALTVKEFLKYKPETYLRWAFYTTFPIGKYDENMYVNLGANRWVFRPMMIFGQPFGKSWIEAYTWARFFTENDKYSKGKSTLEQNPQFGIDLHYSYTVNKMLWFAIDGLYNTGGQTKVDGVKQSDYKNNYTLGATVNLTVSKSLSFNAAYFRTIEEAKNTATKNIATFFVNYFFK